jgi:hypothetical protein
VVFVITEATVGARCIEPPVCESFNYSRAVFVGTVLAVSAKTHEFSRNGHHYSWQLQEARVAIEESFKGVTSTQVDILAAEEEGGGGERFVQGERYLIYAESVPGAGGEHLFVHSCSPTRRLIDASQDLAILRDISRSGQGGRLYGDFREGPIDLERPLPGARIRFTGGQNYYEAVTDAHGRYEINGIPVGKYTALVEPPPNSVFFLRPESPIAVESGGCACAQFWVVPLSGISGHVFDPYGEGVAGEVRLLSADDRVIRHRVRSNGGGAFEIPAVRPGRYLLSVRADPPFLHREDPPMYYYPGAPDTKGAIVIEIQPGSKLVNYNVTVFRGILAAEARCALSR